MTITVEHILQQAREKTGLSDFGDDWFLGPLGAFVSDLKGPHLSEFGREFMARLPVKDMIRRLHVIDSLKRYPEISEVEIPPIVYVTGHERSGTTLLHNLLHQHRGARAMSRWELMMPTPPPEAASYDTDPRRAEVQASIDALKGSDLERMHWVNAGDPEECVWGFMDATGLLGMAACFVMPNWTEWIYTNNMTPTLLNYRRILQLLTWKNPVSEGGFLVLKAPQMTSWLNEFTSIFPGTHFIYVHRDPYRLLTSLCTLADVISGPFLAEPDFLKRREQEESVSLQRMGRYFDNMTRFDATSPEFTHHLHYTDLLEQPVSSAQRLLAEAGQSADPGQQGKIESFLEHQRKGGRAGPRQKFVDVGYTREQVEEYGPVREYIAHYSVATESQRQTGT